MARVEREREREKEREGCGARWKEQVGGVRELILNMKQG
jgi:hypothetical protein